MRSSLSAPANFVRSKSRALQLTTIAVTATAVALWVIAGLLKAAGIASISDLVSLAAYAATAVTVVVGPLSVVASNPA